MSERSKLEQVLEFLLAEDNERAEELLHEYVVETARQEYERILDEDEVVEEAEAEEVDEAEEVAEDTTEAPSKSNLKKMKKAELVDLAKSMDLDSSGTKAVLIERITQA